MSPELSDYFKRKVKYESQEICGVLGLKNASDLIYDVSPKDIGLIQPPFMPNIRFSSFSLTDELICWGSFGLDPDIFLVANPTILVHKSQIQSYCVASNKQMELVYLPYENQPDAPAAQHDQWTDKISQPLLDFLSNLREDQLSSEVKEEMIIELTPSENGQEVTDMTSNFLFIFRWC